MKEYNLFCFPYAGGSAKSIYGKWENELKSTIQLHALELRGHGGRMSEGQYNNVAEAVDELLEMMEGYIEEKPYAIYGHSMGTLLSIEVIQAARKKGYPQPEVIFLSGRKPLHLLTDTKPVSLVTDEEFISSIMKIGGTPKELFETEQLRNIFMPILRNDYRIVDEYKCSTTIDPLDSDLVFFYSDGDELIKKTEVYQWKNYIKGEFSLYDYKGGHFFINDCYKDICHKINKKLTDS